MKFKKTKAFTLLELLVVIGITTILAGVGVSSYINQQRAKLLDTTAQEIVGYLRYAQQKSMAQESGNQWGIHFENPASGNDFYALYTGSSYTSSEETRYLPAGITFQTPSSGNSVDMSYEKLTGFLYGGSYQQIILQNTVGLTKNVLTCQQGLITYNRDIEVCGGIDTTSPVISNVTVSNVSDGSYVDSPFDLSADINEEEGGLSSCEYTINNGTNWYSATVEGFGPSYTCTKTGISSSDGTNLTLNIRATSYGGTGAGSSISRIVDAIAPTCSDNWTDNWTVDSPVNITITPNDARSGVASTKYCVDTIDSCSPTISYSSPVSISCASDSTCIQYARYAAWDNVNNASSVYSKRVRQDKQAPTDGTLTADPGDSQISLSWTIASDSGSGLAALDTYKLVYSTSSSPTINCASDTQIYIGTSTSYLHTDLTNGVIYYYRVCASDTVSNISTGTIASGSPLLSNGEVCSLDSDCLSENCYVDEDGDYYAPAIGTKLCQANSQLSGTDCCDSDDRAYPGQTTYYTSTNNCGSWDYDCDSSITKNSTSCGYATSCNKVGTVNYCSEPYCRRTYATYSCGVSGDRYKCCATCHQSWPACDQCATGGCQAYQWACTGGIGVCSCWRETNTSITCSCK